MKLPNGDIAVVPRLKVVGYLLSSTHRTGRAKAAFFTRFGFSAQRWEELAHALIEHAVEHDLAKTEESPFGARYVVEGTIRTPDGRDPPIRSVWFLESGKQTPRFVTAYPLRRQRP